MSGGKVIWTDGVLKLHDLGDDHFALICGGMAVGLTRAALDGIFAATSTQRAPSASLDAGKPGEGAKACMCGAGPNALDCFCRRAPSPDTTAQPEAPSAAGNEADLAMLVKRLVRQVHKHDSGNDIAAKALDFLGRKGLMGSITRDEDEAKPDTTAGLVEAARELILNAERFQEGPGAGMWRVSDRDARELTKALNEHCRAAEARS